MEAFNCFTRIIGVLFLPLYPCKKGKKNPQALNKKLEVILASLQCVNSGLWWILTLFSKYCLIFQSVGNFSLV